MYEAVRIFPVESKQIRYPLECTNINFPLEKTFRLGSDRNKQNILSIYVEYMYERFALFRLKKKQIMLVEIKR